MKLTLDYDKNIKRLNKDAQVTQYYKRPMTHPNICHFYCSELSCQYNHDDI